MFPTDFGPKPAQIQTSQGTTKITLAAPAPRLSGKSKEQSNPKSHEFASSSLGVVYVNAVARHALMNEKKPQFPVGSVIVREKLSSADAAAADVMVVMVKRERGFNRKANDWEFLMIDGGLSKIIHREKTGSCRDCHVREKDNDYVFRAYMPKAAQVELKADAP